MKLDGFVISNSQKQSARIALEKYGYPKDDFEWYVLKIVGTPPEAINLYRAYCVKI